MRFLLPHVRRIPTQVNEADRKKFPCCQNHQEEHQNMANCTELDFMAFRYIIMVFEMLHNDINYVTLINFKDCRILTYLNYQGQKVLLKKQLFSLMNEPRIFNKSVVNHMYTRVVEHRYTIVSTVPMFRRENIQILKKPHNGTRRHRQTLNYNSGYLYKILLLNWLAARRFSQYSELWIL